MLVEGPPGKDTVGDRVVSNDGRHANSMLDQIRSAIAELTPGRIAGSGIEILHFSDLQSSDQQNEIDIENDEQARDEFAAAFGVEEDS